MLKLCRPNPSIHPLRAVHIYHAVFCCIKSFVKEEATCLEFLLLSQKFLGEQEGSPEKADSRCYLPSHADLWCLQIETQRERLIPKRLDPGLNHHTPVTQEQSLTDYSMIHNVF